MNLCEQLDVLVNDKPLTEFGGRALLDYSIGATPIDSAIFQGVNRTNWNMLKSFFGLRPITLTIVFTAQTLHMAKVNRSRFNAEVQKQCELYITGDGFYYTAYCKSFGNEERIGEGNAEAQIKSTYEFEGIRHDTPQIITVPVGGTVWCYGTMPYTAARLTATVGASAASYQLQGATFKDVVAGDVLVFDGINGAITRNSVNDAGSAEWVNFPALTPGENAITAPDPVIVEFAAAYI